MMRKLCVRAECHDHELLFSQPLFFFFFFLSLFSQQFLPTWLAPNLITFTGFMFLVLNFLMLAFYDFDFNASCRSFTFSFFLNWGGLLSLFSLKQTRRGLNPSLLSRVGREIQACASLFMEGKVQRLTAYGGSW